MTRLTRGVVLASAVAALGTISYLAYGASSIFTVAIAAWIGAFALADGRLEGVALGLVLFAAYVTPAAFVVAIGRNASTFVTIWMGALLATILRTSWRSGWCMPARWRWPLVTAGLTIALSWPMIAYRELDFTLANIWNPRLPVTGVKISGIAAAGGIAFTAAIHLVGLLWFDWLWGRFGSDRVAFLRRAVAPLALALIVSCVVALYQGFVDVSFVSGHIWPSMQRAAGTLMDANVFGMLAALWGPTFIVLGFGSGRRGVRALSVAALFLSLAGVWLSGSRTAMLAAALGLLVTGGSIGRLLPSGRQRRRWAIAAGAAALMLAMALALAPRKTMTAFERARYLVPSLSVASMKDTARQLWARDGYGTTAVAMIREFPLLGVGVGCFSMFAHDFGTESGLDIPPDNAQNWFRQQLVELGLFGSLGWLVWTLAFCVVLFWRPGQVRGAGVALRGPLIAFALASLVGMPGQEAAIVITFWLLVFWFSIDAGISAGPEQVIPKPAWTAISVLVAVYVIAVAVPNDLRPPFRAVRFGFPYSYGMDFEQPTKVWTGKHGVTVQASSGEWMKLSAWVDHPDAGTRPVHVDIWKDRDHIVNERVFLGGRVTRYIHVGRDRRFVLETRVDRTFRPSDAGNSPDRRDLGLALSWEFVQAPPN